MDDETYVKENFNQIAGYDFYVAKKKDWSHRNSKPKKFPDFLNNMWYEKRFENIGYTPADSSQKVCTINSRIFLEQYLEKCLILFIRNHTGLVVFWSDLVMAHYASKLLYCNKSC